MSGHINPYGFTWGGVHVVRLFEAKGHKTVRIIGRRQQVDVRVTPSGLIRIDSHRESDGAFWEKEKP